MDLSDDVPTPRPLDLSADVMMPPPPPTIDPFPFAQVPPQQPSRLERKITIPDHPPVQHLLCPTDTVADRVKLFCAKQMSITEGKLQSIISSFDALIEASRLPDPAWFEKLRLTVIEWVESMQELLTSLFHRYGDENLVEDEKKKDAIIEGRKRLTSGVARFIDRCARRAAQPIWTATPDFTKAAKACRWTLEQVRNLKQGCDEYVALCPQLSLEEKAELFLKPRTLKLQEIDAKKWGMPFSEHLKLLGMKVDVPVGEHLKQLYDAEGRRPVQPSERNSSMPDVLADEPRSGKKRKTARQLTSKDVII